MIFIGFGIVLAGLLYLIFSVPLQLINEFIDLDTENRRNKRYYYDKN